MHVVSGLPTIVYPFKPPKEVVDTLQRRETVYVVFEQLGFPQTQRFLVPAINENPGRFTALWHAPAPDTYVLALNEVTEEQERRRE